ncbi:DUF2924 domain-containing protein [Sphingopyxis indica]|uniref:RAMA domain-containing protein n=1 Tax=Sphingopyxis indica TaxID=436663 RepID=A0A239HEV9_9SPHN|nr:DUF2924 domain-containing protein [Sphingopyxis indica]SNS79568.1 Protein of unknown function [Sphingopyxis indica]
MQIEVDFDVYKALTLLRRNEEDSYNDVVRRLLNIAEEAPNLLDCDENLKPVGIIPEDQIARLLAGLDAPGVWMGNVFLPDGTKFRATYKGQTFRAEIKDQRWQDEEGNVRHSPSDAAGAISGTKVNGWRFWYVKRPNDDDWLRLDDLRR